MCHIKSICYVLPFLIFFGCKENTLLVERESARSSLNGEWILTSYYDLESSEVMVKDQLNSPGLDVLITMDDTNDPPLIYGRSTRNGISGSFEYIDEQTMSVSGFTSSRAGEPEWGWRFRGLAEGQVVRFTVDESTLVLQNLEKMDAAIFQRRK